MKENVKYNLMILLLTVGILLLTRIITVFPWWSFVLPIFILGIVIQKKKWKVNSFWMGFLAGFIVWFGVTCYFDLKNQSLILNKMGLLLSINKYALMLISAGLSGLLCSLSIYSGTKLLASDDENEIEKLIQK